MPETNNERLGRALRQAAESMGKTDAVPNETDESGDALPRLEVIDFDALGRDLREAVARLEVMDEVEETLERVRRWLTGRIRSLSRAAEAAGMSGLDYGASDDETLPVADLIKRFEEASTQLRRAFPARSGPLAEHRRTPRRWRQFKL